MNKRAKLGYEAYRSAAGGKSLVTGAAIPPFEQLPVAIQAAWSAAAEAVEAEVAAEVAARFQTGANS